MVSHAVEHLTALQEFNNLGNTAGATSTSPFMAAIAAFLPLPSAMYSGEMPPTLSTNSPIVSVQAQPPPQTPTVSWSSFSAERTVRLFSRTVISFISPSIARMILPDCGAQDRSQ